MGRLRTSNRGHRSPPGAMTRALTYRLTTAYRPGGATSQRSSSGTRSRIRPTASLPGRQASRLRGPVRMGHPIEAQTHEPVRATVDRHRPAAHGRQWAAAAGVGFMVARTLQFRALVTPRSRRLRVEPNGAQDVLLNHAALFVDACARLGNYRRRIAGAAQCLAHRSDVTNAFRLSQ